MRHKDNPSNDFECKRLVMDGRLSKLLSSHSHRIIEQYHWEGLTIYQLKSHIEQTVSYFGQMCEEKHSEAVYIAIGKVI